MSSQEIFEALVYLYDLGHFLLHARYDSSYTSPVRSKAYDFAYRMFYMVERRTVRDLIVRARTDLGPERRNKAYLEILERDGGKELHFRDVTGFPEKGSETFTRFLSHAKFMNGFHTMKCLSISNRIKWMKLCSLVWGWAGRGFERVVFETDHEGLGENLDRLLQEIDMNTLSRSLEGLDRGITERPPFLDVMRGGKLIEAFGLEFRIDEEDRVWFRVKTA
jgi:hypothetical protein